MINWIVRNKNLIIRNSFLLPILLVVIMSISHVVSWYDLGNPISWAIYLSIAVEIFALASVSAASIKASRGTIWFLFGMVTLIQIVGNIFYEYKEINPNSEEFISWMELIKVWFEDWDATDHRRFLAYIQGGTLPIMSLTSLHFYLQFNDNLGSNSKSVHTEGESKSREESKAERVKAPTPDSKYSIEEMKEAINIWGQLKGSVDGISDDELMNHYKEYINKRDLNIINQPRSPQVNPKAARLGKK